MKVSIRSLPLPVLYSGASATADNGATNSPHPYPNNSSWIIAACTIGAGGGGTNSHTAATSTDAIPNGGNVTVLVKGPGAGRESALRAIAAAGLKIALIRDVTPIPHNGCRQPKRRRV